MTELQARLRALAEPDYQAFASRLLPGREASFSAILPPALTYATMGKNRKDRLRAG